MQFIYKLILNRNSILVFAVILGLIAGDYASKLQAYTFLALAVTMSFSMTGIGMQSLLSPRKMMGPMFVGALLNYIVFGVIVITLAYFTMPTPQLFYGFVVIAAAPPGVAIIPFSYILKGDVEYSIAGVLGAFLSSVIIAPLYVSLFANSQGVSSYSLFIMMVQLVLIPLVISRFLLYKPVFKYVEPVRGKIVDWGFAVLIFVAVGMNRQVFFTSPTILLLVGGVLLAATFGLGSIYAIAAKRFGVSVPQVTAQTMLLTIKSSGFSVFTALALFGKEAAIPSAVLAVVVLIYLIYLSIKSSKLKLAVL